MNEILLSELQIYRNKSLLHSIKESWLKKNLPNLLSYLTDKKGDSISEKIFLLDNEKSFCKICNTETKFLSITRGYREYCSKKCANSDLELSKIKSETFKKTSLEKWGVDNPAKDKSVIDKIKTSRASLDEAEILLKTKKTNLEKWGVENVSQSEQVKIKKRKTTLQNWGVENPFQSSSIKEIIKQTHLNNLGVNHPLKSDIIRTKMKQTILKKWNADNVSKSNIIKQKKLENRNSGFTKSTLNEDLNFSSYLGGGLYEMKCSEANHTYRITRHLYHARLRIESKLCTICNPIGELKSVKELELFEWIRSIYLGEVVTGYKDRLEIDIFIPDLKLGFEFNGLYWHSELFKEKNYHINKTNHFLDRGIKIIHIWEDDWINKKDILKSQIKNWLNLTERKVFARKCQIKKITDPKIVRDFLNKNHIQGSVRTVLNIGMFYDNELISLMTFDHSEGRKTISDSEWNLSRFCNKINTNVIGGASKLLSYFSKEYKPSRIITFADKEWSIGDLYYRLGFERIGDSNPNYKYIVDKVRVNKQRFKKSNLVKEGYDINKSESKIMFELGIHKIYDCGQIKFEKIFNSSF